MIIERFGEKVYDLVLSVTEQNKSLSWEDRKAEALEHIKTFSNDSLLLKSADVISNVSETLSDYEKEGEIVFERFHVGKEKIIENHIKTIRTIMDKKPNSPLFEDMKILLDKIELLKHSC